MSTTTSPAASSGPIPSLDGIRGVAVGLVFFAHSGLENIVPGGLGVTIFFVLSGYLITTLMRSEYLDTGTVSLRAFYLRRLLRLMPPLLLVTTAAALLSAASLVQGQFTGGGLLSVLFYYGNYFVIHHDFHGIPAGIGVVWSLAVEEHFYLLYPPLAIALLGAGRPRLSAITLSALCALILIRRCWLASHGASEAYLNMATDTRVDSILVGCFMGLLCNPWLGKPRPRTAWQDGSLAAVCIAVLVGSLLLRDANFRMTFRYTIQSLAIAPLIYLSVTRSGNAACRWLNSRLMVYLGALSYSIYLSHQVVLYLIGTQWPHLNWLESTLIAAPVTLAIAAALQRWIERPCAALRKKLHRQTPRRIATAQVPVHSHEL